MGRSKIKKELVMQFLFFFLFSRVVDHTANCVAMMKQNMFLVSLLICRTCSSSIVVIFVLVTFAL